MEAFAALQKISALMRDRRATVALVFCLALVPLMGMIGLAIDFGFVTQAKSQLDLAADSAALVATTTAANAFLSNNPNYIALGQQAGQQWFTAQVGVLMDGTIPSTVTPTVTTVQNCGTGAQSCGSSSVQGGTFTTTVTYSGQVQNQFGSIFGIATSSVGGSSVTVVPTNPYTNITFMLDNSSSMLLASTEAGITQLNALTQAASSANMLSVPNNLGSIQCAFACHWDASNRDYYGIATGKFPLDGQSQLASLAASVGSSSAPVQLRFDVMQSAVATSIQSMQTLQQIPNQFSLTVYTFSNDATQVFPSNASQTSSTDLASGLTAVQAVQSPVVIDAANTDFPTSMTTLASKITPAGDGSNPASPKKSLIIVTDGMADYGTRTIPTSEGPMDPSNCLAAKSAGYQVYVLYTTYSSNPTALLNSPSLSQYLVNDPNSVMAQQLQQCASQPSNFIQASSPAEIKSAMQTLLQSALNTGGRFTQ